jgi:hypothetical protein
MVEELKSKMGEDLLPKLAPLFDRLPELASQIDPMVDMFGEIVDAGSTVADFFDKIGDGSLARKREQRKTRRELSEVDKEIAQSPFGPAPVELLDKRDQLAARLEEVSKDPRTAGQKGAEKAESQASLALAAVGATIGGFVGGGKTGAALGAGAGLALGKAAAAGSAPQGDAASKDMMGMRLDTMADPTDTSGAARATTAISALGKVAEETARKLRQIDAPMTPEGN